MAVQALTQSRMLEGAGLTGITLNLAAKTCAGLDQETCSPNGCVWCPFTKRCYVDTKNTDTCKPLASKEQCIAQSSNGCEWIGNNFFEMCFQKRQDWCNTWDPTQCESKHMCVLEGLVCKSDKSDWCSWIQDQGICNVTDRKGVKCGWSATSNRCISSETPEQPQTPNQCKGLKRDQCISAKCKWHARGTEEECYPSSGDKCAKVQDTKLCGQMSMQGCVWSSDKGLCYNKYEKKDFDWCSKAKNQDKCLMFAGKGCAWYADAHKQVCFNKKIWGQKKHWKHKMRKWGMVDWCHKKFTTQAECEKWEAKGCKWYAGKNKQVCYNPKVVKKMKHFKKKWAKHDWCNKKFTTQAECEKWESKGCKWYAGKNKQVCYNSQKSGKGKHQWWKKMMGHHKGSPKIVMKQPVINIYNKFEDANFGNMAAGNWNLSDFSKDPCATVLTEDLCNNGADAGLCEWHTDSKTPYCHTKSIKD